MREVDVVVIGAGIQGVGIAQAMAAAGYSVVVLEQTGVASATSQASSKLIHGGLRYLETAQLSLVRKSLRERDRLLSNAPELVKLLPFYIPLYASSKRRPWQIFAGLCLYAILGGLVMHTRFKRLKKSEYNKLAIKQQGLLAVYQYYDAQTDDLQLTRAVMFSATQLGAELICPARFIAAENNNSHVHVEYLVAEEKHYLSTHVLINAAGPWVNQVLQKITPSVKQLEVDLVQGIHLLLDVPAYAGIFYVEAPQDGRAVFVMPWQGKCLIGTTETVHEGAPHLAQARENEIEYLLSIFKTYFPETNARVLEVMSGLRVLPVGDKSQRHVMFHRPRDTVLYHSGRNILSVYGGKLTGYRSTAEEVVNAVSQCLPKVPKKADTKTLKLAPVDASVFSHRG